MTIRKYAPRRAGKRWLEEAPDYILDVFDNPNFGDRYTVFFTGQLLIWNSDKTSYERFDCHVPYLGMSGEPEHPQGISQWGEMRATDVASYRYAAGHQRIRWLDLPEHVRQHTIARSAE